MARIYTDTILVPMTPAMAEEIRRRALADSRSVAQYVRILLAAALAERGGDAGHAAQ